VFYPEPPSPSDALSVSRPRVKLRGRGALFTPDGSLFVAYGDRGAAVHDGRTGAVLRQIALARSVTFAATLDGHLIVVGDGAALARLSDGVVLFDEAGEAAALSHRSRYVAVLGHHDKTRWREVFAQVWDLATMPLWPSIELGAVQRASDFFDLEFTMSDDKLTVVRRGSNWREAPVTVGVIELPTGKVSTPSAPHAKGGIPAAGIDETWARIAKKHGGLVAPPRKLVPSRRGPGRNVRTYALGERGLVLFSGKFDPSPYVHQVSDLQLMVVDPESGGMVERLALPEPKLSSYSTLDVAFDPTGRFLRLTLGGEGVLHRHVVDVRSGATLHLEELTDSAEVDTWQFSPDGTLMFNDASLLVLDGLRKLRLPKRADHPGSPGTRK